MEQKQEKIDRMNDLAVKVVDAIGYHRLTDVLTVFGTILADILLDLNISPKDFCVELEKVMNVVAKEKNEPTE